MKRRSWLLLSLAFAAVLQAYPAHAVLSPVAIQGDPSPIPFRNYRRIRLPEASDAAGARVTFFSPVDGGEKCLFIVDPGVAAAAIACERGATPDGRLYTKLHPSTINASSVPAFAARTSGGFDGVYRGAPATVVALTNDPLGPQFLDNMTSAFITDAGDVVFLTELTGGTPGDMAILRCSGGDGNCSPTTAPPGTGTLTTLVRLGDALPDRAGREICSITGLRASTFGIAFAAQTKLDCNDDGETPLAGVFRRAFAGPVVTIALVGEVSGVGPTTYTTFRGLPGLSNNGNTAFQADLLGTPSGGLFVCDPGLCPAALPVMAVEIGQLDGSGNLFRTFSAPGISNAGDIVFNTRLGGGPAGATNGVYIWRAATDTLDVLAIKDDPVPGMPGAVFTQFLQGPPVMTSGGKIAFKVRFRRTVAPRNRFGIFIEE
jgi:hypothetical protein